MSLTCWVTGIRSAAAGMRPSGINLSGNVPLRLEEMSFIVKGCRDRTVTYLAKNPVAERGFKASKMPISVEPRRRNNDEFNEFNEGATMDGATSSVRDL